MKCFLTVFWLFFLLFVVRVTGQITFQKGYNGFSTGTPMVFQSGDGGYVVAARKLIKTDALGDTVWTKSYDFGSSAVNSVVQTLDGGYAFAGHTFDFGQGNTDIFLSKTDGLGNVGWSKAYGGVVSEECYGVAATADSGFILVGHTRSFNPGMRDIYLVRTDANGDIEWTRTVGGLLDHQAKSVVETADGGFVVAGNASSNLGYNGFVLKVDSNGNVLWFNLFDGPGGDSFNSIRPTADGGYVLTGMGSNFSTDYPVVMFLIKTDSVGSLEWSHHYAYNFTFGYGVQPLGDGNILLVGQIKQASGYSDVCLIKTNSLGDTLWTRAFGGAGNEVGYSVKTTTDGGYVLSGFSDGFGYGHYLIKTDSLGNAGCNQSSTMITVIDTLDSMVAVTPSVGVGGVAEAFTALVGNGTTVYPICLGGTAIEGPEPAGLVQIYPNPATGRVVVAWDEIIFEGMVEVVDLRGVRVMEERISQVSEVELAVNGMVSGIYFVRVGGRFVGKLIVEN